MTDILLERTFDPGLTPEMVLAGSRRLGWCFTAHNVEWRCSFLAAGGKTMVCWFSAPDAESARLALRAAGADIGRLWTGTAHEGPKPLAVPNVLVERSFDNPVDLQQIEAMERAGAWCLQTHGVRLAHSFVSRDGRRMLCLYRAPDAESVRTAQRQAGLPVDSIWACQPLGPDDAKRSSG